MDWYYTENGSRKGPVAAEQMRELWKNGILEAGTQVWRAGMTGWSPLLQCAEFSDLGQSQEPPPIAHQAMGNGFIWALSLAPVWGAFIQVLATNIRVSLTGEAWVFYSQMWWVMVLVNILTLTLDLKQLRAAGHKTERFQWWMYLLVPVYIYQRDKMLNAGMVRFWVWLAAFAVSFYIL